MSSWKGLRARARSLLRRRAAEAEMDEEFRFHLEMQTEANARAGMSPEEARRQALLAFGGVERHKEGLRDGRGLRWLFDLLQDLRIGVRTLRKRLGFAAAAVATLAIGIGASTALFGVLDGVILRPLPVHDQDRIVLLRKQLPGDQTTVAFPYADVLALGAQSRTLDAVAGVQYDGAWPYPAIEDGRAVTIVGTTVTGDFFGVLGARPALGRLLRPSDAAPGADPVVVISYGLWQRHFGGDPGVVGRRIRFGARPFTHEIVGVAPRGLEYPKGVEAWLPDPATPAVVAERRLALFTILGHLRPGATPEQARAEATAFLRQREATAYLPDELRGHRISVLPLRDAILGSVGTALWTLFGAVLLVLVIAAVNVSGLLLLRAVDRSGEMALRGALGARRGRIVRQLLAEGALLGLGGALLGAALAAVLVRIVVAYAPAGVPRIGEVRLDGRVLTFAAAASTLVALAAALVPALWSGRRDLQATLRRAASVDPETRGVRRARQSLVVGQVALTLVLLAGAGLLSKSLYRLTHLDMGVATDRLVFAHLPMLGAAYQTGQKDRLAYAEAVARRVEATPGIQSATPILEPPFDGKSGWITFYRLEEQGEAEAQANPSVYLDAGLPGFFRTMGITLEQGRGFSDFDRVGAPPVVVVSASFARRAWPGADAVGKRFRFLKDPKATLWTVVGVAADTRFHDLLDPGPTIYIPARQMALWAGPGHPPLTYVAARTTRDPAFVAAAMRRAVHEVDPGEHVFDVQSMEQLLAGPLARPRFSALVLGALAGVALLLAMIGLYGILASLVARRTRELAIRRALGADARAIRGLVVGRALLLVVIGALVGLGAAVAGGRIVASMLVNVSPTDPLVLAGAVAVLLGVALGASYLPARRATRIEPMEALRTE